MRVRKFLMFFSVLPAAIVSGGCVIEDLVKLPKELESLIMLLQDLFPAIV